jgi:Protein of unknown function (DUF1045)
MNEQPRYAIYIAPPADTPLWAFGSRVLGYDAATGLDIDGFHLPGFEQAVWRQLTAGARVYGFHATLKAPFRLKPAYEEIDLCASVGLLATGVTGFSLGALAPSVLSGKNDAGFVALTPRQESGELASLERRAVEELDDYRALPTEAEIARRQPEILTERQRAHLQRYGYPYVIEDYRFHMTLTDRISRPEILADLMADELCNTVGTANFTVSDLVLFRQDSPQDRFRILRRFPLQPA